MLNKSCIEFINQLSSKSPVPGGGGASALVASIGMSLGSMVGNLTLGKKKYEEVQEDIKLLLGKSQELTGKLNGLVSEDAEAFEPLVKAYGMPRGTEEEKFLREKILQDALAGAVMVPMKIARCCAEAIALHEEYAEKGTRIAISDVGVGVIFCKAALQGAKLNVLINLDLMKGEDLKNKILAELTEIEKESLTKADCVFNKVEKMISTNV